MSLLTNLYCVSRTQALALKSSPVMTKPSVSVKYPQTYSVRKYNRQVLHNSCISFTKGFHDVSNTSFQNIDAVKATLFQQGLPIHDGYTCIVTQCQVAQKNIYVNKTTGKKSE